MRKSSAPSLQGQSAKRRKFSTPFNGNSSSNSGRKFQTPFKSKTDEQILHDCGRQTTAVENVEYASAKDYIPNKKPSNGVTVEALISTIRESAPEENPSNTLTVKPSKTSFVKPSNSQLKLGKPSSLLKSESNQQDSSFMSTASLTKENDERYFEVLWYMSILVIILNILSRLSRCRTFQNSLFI